MTPSIRFSLCLILLLTWNPLAIAGIFQCEDEDGRTIFSDQPCKSGINKEIEVLETVLDPFVSGRITQNDQSFAIRHGVALWDKENNAIKLLLTNSPMTETQTQQAYLGDWSFLDQHKQRGLAEITLTFKTSQPSLNQLRSMKSSFYGLTAEIEKPWTTHHGGSDVIGHVHKLEFTKENKKHWIAFASQEMSPEIRWNINLVLTISE